MVTEKNMALMVEAGFPSIVGYHKRGRLVSDSLLEQFTDTTEYARIRDNLSYLEVPIQAVGDENETSGVC